VRGEVQKNGWALLHSPYIPNLAYGLPSVRVRKGSYPRPAVCDGWVGPGSRLPLITNCWNGILPQGDLHVSRRVAKMQRSGYGFCREESAVHRFDLTWRVPIHVLNDCEINFLVPSSMDLIHFSSFYARYTSIPSPTPQPACLYVISLIVFVKFAVWMFSVCIFPNLVSSFLLVLNVLLGALFN
jgi:hypothetical protein